MESLIETFHIDTKLLAAQIINFGIVFGVLYFFAIKPLLKIMSDRGEKIEKSLTDAKLIDEKLKKTEEEYLKKIQEAKKEAAQILEKAKERGEAKKNEMIEKAKEEIGKVINEEKEAIRQEKQAVLKELKSEVADLVVSAAAKFLEKKIDLKQDAEIIKKSLSSKL